MLIFHLVKICLVQGTIKSITFPSMGRSRAFISMSIQVDGIQGDSIRWASGSTAFMSIGIQCIGLRKSPKCLILEIDFDALDH